MSFRLLKSDFSLRELPRRIGKVVKDVLDGGFLSYSDDIYYI